MAVSVVPTQNLRGEPALHSYSADSLAGAAARTTTEQTDTELAAALLTAVQHRDYFRRKHDLYDIAMSLDADGIRRAAECTQQFPPSERDWAQPTLVARWLDVDRDGAWEWISALPSGEQRTELWREFFHSLGMKDPEAALPFLDEHVRRRARNETDFADSVFEAWSTYDAIAAARIAVSLPRRGERSSALSSPLAAWTHMDPQGAFAFAQGLTEPSFRDESVIAVLRTWATAEPKSALAAAETLPQGKQRREAVSEVIEGAAQNSAKEALALIDAMPVGFARTEATNSLMHNRSYEDPSLAVECLFRLPLEKQEQAIRSVFPGVAREDPARALELAATLSTSKLREIATDAVLSRWADDEPAAAADFWLKNQPGDETGPLYEIVSEWAQDDFPAALSWAKRLPSGKAHDEAVGQLLNYLAGRQPEVAIENANALLKGEIREETLVSLAATWAENDPAAAAGFAERLPDEPSRKDAAQQIAGKWAQQDLEGVTRWLNSMASGPVRDYAISGFIRTISETDAEGALAWAVTLSDVQQRDSLVEHVMGQWRQHDSVRAFAWLRAHAVLAPERRQRLLQSFTRRGDDE